MPRSLDFIGRPISKNRSKFRQRTRATADARPSAAAIVADRDEPKNKYSRAAKVEFLEHASRLRSARAKRDLPEPVVSIEKVCKQRGYSRDSLYRWQTLYEIGGDRALEKLPRKKPLLLNRTLPEVEAAIVALTMAQPDLGQARIAEEMRRDGYAISASGVRGVWLRYDMETSNKRLEALAAKVLQGDLIPTESQRILLEQSKRRKREDVGVAVIYPGDCGAQDTLVIDEFQGLGRIFQQTFVDGYSRVAIAKLYDAKRPDIAADFLRERVIPFYEARNVNLRRVLTDRQDEYYGNPVQHPYERFLHTSGIEHTHSKGKSDQGNVIVQPLHMSLRDEFYAPAIRKNAYRSLEALQADLDTWLAHYNEQRHHSGRFCYGKTPLQTFMDAAQPATDLGSAGI